MEDYIIGVIEEILNGVTSMGGDGGLLVQTPAPFLLCMTNLHQVWK